jgi:pilus assembly protein Flp/PilA
MKSLISRFVKDESGATAIEYALIAGIIGIGIAVGARNFVTSANDKYNELGNSLKAAK